MTEKFFLNEEYITLGALLKLEGIIDTGGGAKQFLQENPVFVNGKREERRGRKLYDGDRIKVNEQLTIVIEGGGSAV